MSKRKAKSKKPSEPKPVRIKCHDCGAEYDAGAPHSGFCPGCPPGSTCAKCEEVGDTDPEGESQVAVCRDCGDIFCSSCGNTDERQCFDCEAERGEERRG